MEKHRYGLNDSTMLYCKYTYEYVGPYWNTPGMKYPYVKKHGVNTDHYSSMSLFQLKGA